MNTIGTLPRTLLSLLIMAAGALSLILLGTPEVPTRPPDQVSRPIVRTAIAQPHTDGIQFEVDGVVVPFRQIEIAAEVSGRIAFQSEHCRTGRGVKQGELLLRIEQSDYQLEVARLVEELKQAEAMERELELEIVTADNQIELTRQQLEIDARQLDRNVRLSTTAAASQTELDTARRAELATRNALQSLQDNRNLLNQRLVRMASGKALVKANLDKAKLSLDRTEIHAPLDGIIVSERVEKDGYVQAGDTVITFQDTSQLDVTCKLHMRQMHWLWQTKSAGGNSENGGTESADDIENLVEAYDFPATPATILYQLGPTSYQWHGVVDRYDGAGIDNQTRMIPCRVHVDRPLEVIIGGVEDETNSGAKPPTLMTGMFVKVRIDATPPIPFVRIPQAAIQPGNAVWTVDGGKLRRKQVRIATSGPDFIVAYSQADGLQANDSVVVSPLATPVEGLAVQEVAEP